MANDGDRPESDDIDLSLDDLDEEPLPPVSPAPPAAGDMLVITGDDLLDVSDEALPSAYPAAAAPGAYPGIDGGAYAAFPGKKGKQGFVPALLGSMWLHMLIAGGIGGLLAWAITEPTVMATIAGIDVTASGATPAVALWVMIYFGIIGGLVGLFLGAVEGVVQGNPRRALIGGAVALGIGAVGGGLAGLLGQTAYGILVTPDQTEAISLRLIIARTIGWTIAGVFIGLAQGASTRSVHKVVNGLIGGAIGGCIGGALFDFIAVATSLLMGGAGNAGLVSRLVALVLIGAATGAAIGLIEELRKEAWLVITRGPLTGKQFILYNAVTTIGSSPKCDIALLKDQQIAPQHCVIEISGGQHTLRDAGTQTGTAVNGRPIQRHSLRRGDIIQIGQTTLEYQDRAVEPAGRPF